MESGQNPADARGSPQPQRERQQRASRNQRNQENGENHHQPRHSGYNGKQQNGGYRQERVYQRKGGDGDSGAEESPRPGRNYNKRGSYDNNRGKQRQYSQKDNQKDKTQKQEVQEPSKLQHNERFDNSSLLVAATDQSANPHLSLAIAESKRLAELIPTGLSDEVMQQIQRIREAIPKVEPHIIYSVLEGCGFDEDKTVSYFLEKQQESEQGQQEGGQAPRAGSWTNVVKKGLPPPKQQPVQDRRKKQYQDQRTAQPQQEQTNGLNIPAPDPEELVNNLAVAIENQLRLIQQQTQMLHALQNELLNVTQSGGGELQQLLAEQQNLYEQERQLREQLENVRIRIKQVEIAIRNKEQEKQHRIQELANKSAQVGIFKPPALVQAPRQAAPVPRITHPVVKQ